MPRSAKTDGARVRPEPAPHLRAASAPAVLIAVLGSSPAVLTEAVWALAHETPPILPTRVVAVTTVHGESNLRRQLLTPEAPAGGVTVWQSLRASLLGSAHLRDPRLTLDPPVVIGTADPSTGTTRPLDDIRTAADNLAAGETILATVRRFTTDPETRVLGLLAGGRKTMGALLHAALSLAGRPGDRLFHVLVNQPFDDSRLQPPFYFPGQPRCTQHSIDGHAIAHANARIELAEVPLVALGELVFARTKRRPATFAALARDASTAVAQARTLSGVLELSYDPSQRRLILDGYTCEVPVGRPAALCAALWERALASSPLLDRINLAAALKQCGIGYRRPDGGRALFEPEDISNALNVLRKSLSDAGASPLLVERLLPRRRRIGFNQHAIHLVQQ